MPLNFFKTNKKKLGMLSSWSFNSKEETVYAGFKKQTGYDSDTGVGTFKDGAFIKVKFSKEEVGAILSVIEGFTNEYSFVHESEEFVTNILFRSYFKEEELKGYIIEIRRDKSNFKAAYNIKDGIILREFLKFSLEHIFTAIYSQDKKEALAKKKEAFIQEETEKNTEETIKKTKNTPKNKETDDDVNLEDGQIESEKEDPQEELF